MSFGKNDEYLTFDVLKPGTMYVVDPNKWGYKGGTDNDYKFLDDYKIAGCSTYYKHFEAGKVTVPAQDTDKYTVGTRQPNTIGFVFVFDDESSTDIKSLSYKFDGVTNTISYIRNNTHLAPIEITPDYPYTGDVEVFINPVMEGATVEAIGSLDKGCGAVIARVTSKDGKATRDYTLNFNYVISNDANLKYVKADGEPVTFESGRKATINVPYGAEVPEITYEVNNKKASAVMESAENVTTITVTAEDGVTVKVYTIIFNIDLGSDDATLKSLKYGENEVALEADKYDYAVELPYGSEIPAVTYEVNDENAKAEANTVDGVTTITVTAQNGTVKTYTLTLTVKVPSTDAYLKYVKANGETLAFESGKNATITLPYGSQMPEIIYEVNDENASAVMETAGNVITITVTAEDGVTTKAYTITVNFEEPKNMATITIATNGQEILATIGANDKVSLGNTNTAVYEYGTNIELEAIAAEGQTFMYWKSGDAIVCENALYGFVTGSERDIEAVFADADAYTIAFRSNGKIIAAGTVIETVPQDPYWAGYVFKGWYVGDNKTDLKAGDAIGEITESVTYRAGYTKSEEVYTVEIFNGENADALVYTKQYNDKVEVTASDVAEKEFAYWMRDGKIVSYSQTYTFYVSADTQLVANYAAEQAEVMPVVITLAKPTQIGDSKLAYYAERNVDETYTVIESGILLDNVAEFDVNSARTKAIAKNTDNAGQFTVRKANVVADQQWYAKAYVIYQDASGNIGIAYSELVGPDTVK